MEKPKEVTIALMNDVSEELIKVVDNRLSASRDLQAKITQQDYEVDELDEGDENTFDNYDEEEEKISEIPLTKNNAGKVDKNDINKWTWQNQRLEQRKTAIRHTILTGSTMIHNFDKKQGTIATLTICASIESQNAKHMNKINKTCKKIRNTAEKMGASKQNDEMQTLEPYEEKKISMLALAMKFAKPDKQAQLKIANNAFANAQIVLTEQATDISDAWAREEHLEEFKKLITVIAEYAKSEVNGIGSKCDKKYENATTIIAYTEEIREQLETRDGQRAKELINGDAWHAVKETHRRMIERTKATEKVFSDIDVNKIKQRSINK